MPILTTAAAMLMSLHMAAAQSSLVSVPPPQPQPQGVVPVSTGPQSVAYQPTVVVPTFPPYHSSCEVSDAVSAAIDYGVCQPSLPLGPLGVGGHCMVVSQKNGEYYIPCNVPWVGEWTNQTLLGLAILPDNEVVFPQNTNCTSSGPSYPCEKSGDPCAVFKIPESPSTGDKFTYAFRWMAQCSGDFY